jgi:hypothetical protein
VRDILGIFSLAAADESLCTLQHVGLAHDNAKPEVNA